MKKNKEEKESNKNAIIAMVVFISLISFALGTLFGKALFEINNENNNHNSETSK